MNCLSSVYQGQILSCKYKRVFVKKILGEVMKKYWWNVQEKTIQVRKMCHMQIGWSFNDNEAKQQQEPKVMKGKGKGKRKG